jgi:uncharacterized protein YodC (DUF2158 family)
MPLWVVMFLVALVVVTFAGVAWVLRFDHNLRHPKSSPKIGDVVLLRSGGPKMVVEYVRDDGVAEVVWFSCRRAASTRDAFHLTQVRRVRWYD